MNETELQTESKASQEVEESWVNSPTVQDIYLNSNADTSTYIDCVPTVIANQMFQESIK